MKELNRYLKYKDNQHKLFVNSCINRLNNVSKNDINRYFRLFYIIGIDEELSDDIDMIFDFSKKVIKTEVIENDLLNYEQKQRIRLAFHLFNGWDYESDEDAELEYISEKYSLNSMINAKFDLVTIQFLLLLFLNGDV